MAKGDYIKVRYSDMETGWAEDLGDGTVKIANCPLAPGLGLGDVCSTYQRADGWRTIAEVIQKRYPHAATFWYQEDRYFFLMAGACRVKDWGMEGGIGAREGQEGFATINYDGEQGDLEALVELLRLGDGVRITRGEEEEVDPEDPFI